MADIQEQTVVGVKTAAHSRTRFLFSAPRDFGGHAEAPAAHDGFLAQ
jgi:hypothetical protein